MKNIKKRIRRLFDILNCMYANINIKPCELEIIKTKKEIIAVKNTTYGLRVLVITKNSIEYKDILNSCDFIFSIRCGLFRTVIETSLTEKEVDLALLEFEEVVEQALVLPFMALVVKGE